MIRKLSVIVVLLLILSAMSIPAMAAGGNGGSSGSDGAGSSGSGGGGNGDGSAGNAGNGAGSSSTGDPQAQVLQEEQERKQQETVEQPGVQINQQDQDQTQGRTGVDTSVETISPDIVRQRDRDTFLQQISHLEQNFSRDQDRDQAKVHLALSSFSLAGNVTGSSGPELTRLGAEVNNSLAIAYQTEQQMKSRSSFMRMLFGGDREAAGLLIQYVDQNQQRIQQMMQIVANCSECDPQVRMMFEEQVQVLSQEQNRLIAFGQQEQGDRGLFGWLFGGART